MSDYYTKITPNYGVLDERWNINPSTTKQSIKFVLFEGRPGGNSFRRERYLYSETAGYDSMMDEETPTTSLLKVPIRELLDNIEAKKRQKIINQNGEDKPMAASSSTDGTVVSKIQTQPQPKRRLNEIYAPKQFMDLIGSDKINRFALKWLKSWDFKVFKKVALY